MSDLDLFFDMEKLKDFPKRDYVWDRLGGTMRLYCWFCHKSVSNEVPESTVVRAVCVCPECIEAKKITFPEDEVKV